jgi:Mrp family chromosome partitioning ATPase
MGRMFRILSETAADRIGAAVADTPAPTPQKAAGSPVREDESPMNPFANESIPFVEVGGPEGVVTSTTRTVHTMPYRVVGAVPPARFAPASPPPAAYQTTPFQLLYPPEPRFAPAPQPAPRPAPAPAPAEDPRVLSVAFHKFPKPGLRVLPAGIAPEVVTYHYPDHPISAEYRLVRDEIRRSFDQPAHRVVSLTGMNAAAGTTTVLLNVAVAMTQDTGSRVLVVDGNVLRPAVAARLAVGDAPGLCEVLAQSVPLAWSIQTTAVAGLHVLAAGVATEKTLATLPTELPRLLNQVRQWFDYVCVDVGAWENTSAHAASHLAAACDSVYLVSRQADLERMEYHHLRNALGSTLKGYISTRQ